MPRYFFHVIDGFAQVDTLGTELISLEEARMQAVEASGRILADLGRQFWGDGREWTMTVADEAGRVVFSLRFSADDHGVASLPSTLIPSASPV